MKTKDHNLNKVLDTGRNQVVESWISSMKIIQDLAWDMEDSFFYREKPLTNNIMFYDNPERP